MITVDKVCTKWQEIYPHEMHDSQKLILYIISTWFTLENTKWLLEIEKGKQLLKLKIGLGIGAGHSTLLKVIYLTYPKIVLPCLINASIAKHLGFINYVTPKMLGYKYSIKNKIIITDCGAEYFKGISFDGALAVIYLD